MKPRIYQQAAINAACAELKQHDRCTIVMACGTGKTLVALWIAEKLKAQRIIIFMPTLALIRQTIEAWVNNNTYKNIEMYTLCSENKIYDDIPIEDLNGTVLTSTQMIIEALKPRPKCTQLVFSTYLSATLIHSNIQFDLGIFDEAHKTAHETPVGYRFALHNDNVAITKRVFMTATPKVYKYRTNNLEGNKIDYSMDNEKVYGKTVYHLSLPNAIKEEIVCDYKIMITVINKKELTISGIDPNIKSKSIMEIQAFACALQKSFKQAPISKTITFHRTIDEAKLFQNHFNNIKPTSIENLHINGLMDQAARHTIIKRFKESQSATISNSRFLSEGVDIPAINLVAFMTPKRSAIDITQIIGRAIRKSPHKQYGYILVPIFIDTSDIYELDNINIEKNYRTLWRIITTLSHYDYTLQNELNDIKLQRSTLINSPKKISVIGDEQLNKELINSINIYIINRFADTWYETYEKYKDHVKNHGHLTTSKASVKKYHDLVRWIRLNRMRYNQGTLQDDKINRLQDIGFSFTASDDRWMNSFNKFKKKVQQYGINKVNASNDKISQWFYWQRKTILNNTITNNKKHQLMDFIKSVTDEDVISIISRKAMAFNKHLPIIKKFYKEHGHLCMPRKYSPTTGAWLQKIRANKQLLTLKQIKTLDNMNIKWNEKKSLSLIWNQRYEELIKHYKKYNSFSFGKNMPNKQLAQWVCRQKKNFKQKRLDKDKRDKLKNIGFFKHSRSKRTN